MTRGGKRYNTLESIRANALCVWLWSGGATHSMLNCEHELNTGKKISILWNIWKHSYFFVVGKQIAFVHLLLWMHSLTNSLVRCLYCKSSCGKTITIVSISNEYFLHHYKQKKERIIAEGTSDGHPLCCWSEIRRSFACTLQRAVFKKTPLANKRYRSLSKTLN